MNGMTTFDDQIERALSTERALATLSTGFGILALVISVVGLYGVMSFVATQRRREIGLRVALGATRRDAVWLVLRDALLMIAAGVDGRAAGRVGAQATCGDAALRRQRPACAHHRVRCRWTVVRRLLRRRCFLRGGHPLLIPTSCCTQISAGARIRLSARDADLKRTAFRERYRHTDRYRGIGLLILRIGFGLLLLVSRLSEAGWRSRWMGAHRRCRGEYRHYARPRALWSGCGAVGGRGWAAVRCRAVLPASVPDDAGRHDRGTIDQLGREVSQPEDALKDASVLTSMNYDGPGRCTEARLPGVEHDPSIDLLGFGLAAWSQLPVCPTRHCGRYRCRPILSASSRARFCQILARRGT